MAPKKAKQSLGSSFKKTNVQQPGPVALSIIDAIEVELKSYLQAMEDDGEADPLEWWRLHQAWPGSTFVFLPLVPLQGAFREGIQHWWQHCDLLQICTEARDS